MWRKLSREDLEGRSPLLPEKERHQFRFYWRVYEDYEFLPSNEDDGEYIQAARREGYKEPKCVKLYDPFIDTPYLFLEFARIVERNDPYKALKEWIMKYGLLGFTPRNPLYSKDETSLEKRHRESYPLERYDDRGGPHDTFALIAGKSSDANYALSLYEAVLSRDKEKLERVLFFYFEEGHEYREERRKRLEDKAAATGASWTDALVDAATSQIIEFTIHPIHAFTFPTIAYPPSFIGSGDKAPLLTIEGLTQGWTARNLVGAMHLQFYWLITSGEDLSRCRHCNRIISYAPPIPGGDDRKPRRDKQFCDSRCRQNYHYENRIKPRRQDQDA